MKGELVNMTIQNSAYNETQVLKVLDNLVDKSAAGGKCRPVRISTTSVDSGLRRKVIN